jgi:hypothetical protein
VSPEQILEELLARHSARLAEFELSEPTQHWLFDELADAWRAGEAEATCAYDQWRRSPDADAYAVYRAAQDRADQAQDALAARYAARVASPCEQGAAAPATAWSEAGPDPRGRSRAVRA